jgi:hypothetical protein
VIAGLLIVAAGLSAQRRTTKVFVSVVESGKTAVTDLSPADFAVFVGGVKCEVVRASLAKEPMRIVLLVDTSAQAKLSLNHIRGGLQAFVDAIPAQNEIALVSTGGQARVRVPPTVDRGRLKSAIDGFFTDGGANVLLDALPETYNRFLRRVEDRWPVFVMLTTDGPDDSGIRDREFDTFIREIVSVAATAHAIALTSPLQSAQDSRALAAGLSLTQYTGGRYEALAASSALPVRMKALGEQMAAHQRAMSAQYEVDFVSASKDPQAGVEVRVAREGASIGLSAGRPLK